MTTITSQPKNLPINSPRVEANNDSPQEPKKSSTMVDKIIDKTYLGSNYTASTLSGGVAGMGAFCTSAPGAVAKTIPSLYKNFLKTETVGLNLKILGSLVAGPAVLAGAVIGLPVSLIAGMVRGAGQVDSSKPRHFTIPAASNAGYNKTKEGWSSMTKSALESFEELGAQKLKPGEKAIDIPIIKTLKTVALGVAGVAVGGIAGIVSAVVGTVRETVAGIGQAFSDKTLSIPGKLLASGEAVVGGVVHGAAYGVTTAFSVLGNGISQTWKNDSLVDGGKSIFGEAKNSVLAAAAPQATLLREKGQAAE